MFPCTAWAVQAGCARSAGTGTVPLPPEPPAAGESRGAIATDSLAALIRFQFSAQSN